MIDPPDIDLADLQYN